jgi:Listeria/Bacterioides repeat
VEKQFLSGFFVWLVAIGIVFAQSDSEDPSELEPPHAIVRLSEHGESVELSCDVPLEGDISYQWYKSTSNSVGSGIAMEGENSRHFTTASFPKKGIRFYFCIATSSEGISEPSDIFVVAYTGLPIVKINTVNGEEPSAEYAYPPSRVYGRGITNATKVPASMQIVDSSGTLVYESGDYEKGVGGLTIKLRGNTSVDLEGKSSYKLKLQKKADLLAPLISRSGKSYQDKEWILHKDATTLNTIIGFWVCDIAGVPWTPKYNFVNVVINNDYRGLYLLMESVNRSESRVDVSKDGYIIERDAYWWNEDVVFETSVYNQKYTFKYPDDDKISKEQISYIKNYVNVLEWHVSYGTYDNYIDVKSFARWLLVHDFLGTLDAAGSNIFMSKYDTTKSSKLQMLTNWDFDTNYMREDMWAMQHDENRMYAASMFKSANRSFAKTYKALYDSIAPILWKSLEKKLKGLDEALADQIVVARYCDLVRWNLLSYNPVAYDYSVAKEWFTSREAWLKKMMKNSYAVSYVLNGGEFKDKKSFPKSIKFLDRVEVPQPQKSGFVFSGWMGEHDTIPQKNLVLYGYNMTKDIQLTAHWISNIRPIQKVHEDFSLKKDNLVGKESFSVQVFNVLGSFLGHISLYNTDMQLIKRTLKEAGFATGVYILRSKELHMTRRVQMR